VPERFADIATIVAKLLGENVNSPQRVGISVPPDLTGLMPYIRVTRSGGPRDRLNDVARITVDVLDSNYTRGVTTAENVAAFLEPARLRRGPVVLDRVAVDSAPREVAPWAPGVFRFEAAYTVVSRRHQVP
jgi:hypothetical protein